MTALLLDEMMSPTLAGNLRAAGYDVLAIGANPSLRGISDPEVLALANRERRVLFTRNVRDFAQLAYSWAAEGRTHTGLLFLSSKSFPSDRSQLGRLTAALEGRFISNRWPSPGEVDFLQASNPPPWH